MTTENLAYQKALETVGNTHPPARGFETETSVSIPGDKILVTQHNLIIELLIQLHHKIDTLVVSPVRKTPALNDILANINTQLETLQLSTKPKSKPSQQQLVVWTDPKTLFPKK